MTTAPHARRIRSAAVSASTVFAIALAIVAGLIFAWLFKIVLLDRQPPPVEVTPKRTLTVAAVNIYDQMEIRPIHVKKIKLTEEQFNERVPPNRRSSLLNGDQPIGRVTKQPIKAETPIFEDEVLPFHYPAPVSEELRPGMSAVIVSVGAKDAMVQVGDIVNLYASLGNPAFGGTNGNATALLAENARVVARFNTTRPGAQPESLTAPRTYTLEVTPYRFALIELAKVQGAEFSLGVAHRAGESGGVTPMDPNLDQGKDPSLVTTQDLAEVFGVTPPVPPTPPWAIERYVGIRNAGRMTFPNYAPTRPTPPVTSPGTVAPASNTTGSLGGSTQPVARANTSLRSAPVQRTPGASNSFGFRPPGVASDKKDCPTCGGKKR